MDCAVIQLFLSVKLYSADQVCSLDHSVKLATCFFNISALPKMQIIKFYNLVHNIHELSNNKITYKRINIYN